jgi:HlyD family secretion protein
VKWDVKRSVTWGAFAAALVALLAWALWPRPRAVDLTTVEQGPLVVTLEEEGETRVRERFLVSAPVAGRLLRIELEPGDPVRSGETVLAVLQPRESTLLDARSRAEAEAEVMALEAELERAKHNREAARAELEFSRLELQRARELEAQDVFSDEQLDAAALAEKRAADGRA